MFQTQNVFRRVNCSNISPKITLFKLNENADTSLQEVLYSSLLIKSDPQRNKVNLSNLSFNFSTWFLSLYLAEFIWICTGTMALRSGWQNKRRSFFRQRIESKEKLVLQVGRKCSLVYRLEG